MFGIARRVYASYYEAHSLQQHKLQRLAGRRDLEPDQVEELLDRIDAERAGRDLIGELAMLPERDGALHKLGDRVVVVPVRAGCPSLRSLRPPAVPVSRHLSVQTTVGTRGSVTVNAKGIPAGDILVVGVETTTTGNTCSSMGAEG